MSAAAALIEDAISELRQAQSLLRDMQQAHGPVALHSGETVTISRTTIWQQLESIDDRIHDALTKLGD